MGFGLVVIKLPSIVLRVRETFEDRAPDRYFDHTGSSQWHERRIGFTRLTGTARTAIEAFAKRAGYAVAEDDWFYDADVKGAGPVTKRPGFKVMLDRIAGNGVQWCSSRTPAGLLAI
jgi:hypothetical protein